MEKFIPRASAYTQAFWDGCRENTLRYQNCRQCGTVQLIPRTVCTNCHAPDLQWNDSAGIGTILSYTTVYRAPTPAFKADVPYVIALIDMDEGFRLMTNVRQRGDTAVSIGQRVTIGFEPRGDVTMPIAELKTS